MAVMKFHGLSSVNWRRKADGVIQLGGGCADGVSFDLSPKTREPRAPMSNVQGQEKADGSVQAKRKFALPLQLCSTGPSRDCMVPTHFGEGHCCMQLANLSANLF